jgi:protocatechuate 3,4-dioxygenase, alpha subunit
VRPTPSQTIGPFFHRGMEWLSPDSDGVELTGRVLDGDGRPVTDALIELWQPGRFVRAFTNEEGKYRASVARSGPIDISVFARGLLQRLVTRAYLPDDADDDVLRHVGPGRQQSLRCVADGTGLRFDIRLQGEGETVFFAW